MSECSLSLGSFRHGKWRLLPMSPESLSRFARELACIDPWLRLGYPTAAIERYFSADSTDRLALSVLADEQPAACLTIRPNWLRGPLLELLAVLPEFQGQGLGKEIIAWLIDETGRQGQANLWTISSEFNHFARDFYRRLGFEETGWLPGLIKSSETEILLRRRLLIDGGQWRERPFLPDFE